jgi:hypothetical protein
VEGEVEALASCSAYGGGRGGEEEEEEEEEVRRSGRKRRIFKRLGSKKGGLY